MVSMIPNVEKIFLSVNDLVQEQAKKIPDKIKVGNNTEYMKAGMLNPIA